MRPLTEQELHNLAMNIVGHELEHNNFEFLAVNSKLKRNPQFVCLKDKQNYFIVVRAVLHPESVLNIPQQLLKPIKEHATKNNAELYYASVGLANAKDPTLPVYFNEDYSVSFGGLTKI